MNMIYRYWRSCSSRGDKPLPVYAIAKTWWNATDAGDHIAHWELSRQRAARWIDSQDVPADYTICKIEYVR